MLAFRFSAILFLVYVAQCVNRGQRVDIILSGRDIPKSNFWTNPYPYVKVFYKYDSTQNWINYGVTTISANNPNPDWPQVFTFDYVGGMAQIVKYELWNEGWIWDSFVGDLHLPLGEIVDSAVENGGLVVEGHVQPIPKSGRLLMKVRIDGIIP